MKDSQLFIKGNINDINWDLECNHVYLPTRHNRDTTLLQVPIDKRHKGLYVTYIDGITKEAVTLKYIANCVEGLSWITMSNWIDATVSEGTGGDGSGDGSGSQPTAPISLRASASEGQQASATVTALEEPNSFEVAFTIPRGATGPQGPQGVPGPQGPAGANGSDGKDGVALPGTFYEHRYALSSKTQAPTINRTSRNPGNNWLTTYPTITNKATQGIWITNAKINSDDTLGSDWNTPTLYISYGTDGTDGAQGPAGPQGPQGPAGEGFDMDNIYIGDDGCWWENGQTTGKPALNVDISTGTPPEIPNFYSYVYYRGASKPASLNDNGTQYNTVDDILRNTAWEDFPVGEGPWWQTTLLIKGTTRVILKISEPLPFNQEGVDGSDGVWTKMMFMWYFVGTGYSKINWDTWYNANKSNANPNTAQTSFEVNPGKCPGDLKDYEYIMISAQFKTVDGVQTMMSDWSYPVNIKGETGVAGPAGQRGPIMYPAGVWQTNKEYTRTEDAAPYVHYNGQWYWLKTLGRWISTSDSNNPSNSADWAQMTQYEAIFAKIGIIGNGLIGQAVFNGNWMFSQRGIDINGDPSSDFENFNAENPFSTTNIFRPSFALNFITGELFFANGTGRLTQDGVEFVETNFTPNANPTSGGGIKLTKDKIKLFNWATSSNPAYNYTIELTKDGLTLKNNVNKIIFGYNSIKFYKYDELINTIGIDGTVTNSLTVKNLKRVAVSTSSGNEAVDIDGAIIIAGSGEYNLPALNNNETVDIVLINPYAGRTNEEIILHGENYVTIMNPYGYSIFDDGTGNVIKGNNWPGVKNCRFNPKACAVKIIGVAGSYAGIDNGVEKYNTIYYVIPMSPITIDYTIQ